MLSLSRRSLPPLVHHVGWLGIRLNLQHRLVSTPFEGFQPAGSPSGDHATTAFGLHRFAAVPDPDHDLRATTGDSMTYVIFVAMSDRGHVVDAGPGFWGAAWD